MKATELIKELEKGIEKYGDDLEVFVEFPGMNCEDTYDVRDGGLSYVHVENLSKYPVNLKYEDHGEGTGLIWGIVIFGDNMIDHSG